MSPEESSPPPISPHAIEQYKAKLSDLGNLGTRQSSMTTYYISIVSALIGLLALKEPALSQIDPAIVLMICGAGLLICLLWFFTVTYFRRLFYTKLSILESMERTLPYQTFAQEFTMLHPSQKHSWLWYERFIPVVFGLLFLGVGLFAFTHH